MLLEFVLNIYNRHFVTILPNTKGLEGIQRLALLSCTCEGHAKTAECSHQVAIGHLMQYFNCDDTVTSLEGALKKLGRPTAYVAVGYATKDPVNNRNTG